MRRLAADAGSDRRARDGQRRDVHLHLRCRSAIGRPLDDRNGVLVTYAYDANDRLLTEAGPTRTLTFTYDAERQSRSPGARVAPTSTPTDGTRRTVSSPRTSNTAATGVCVSVYLRRRRHPHEQDRGRRHDDVPHRQEPRRSRRCSSRRPARATTTYTHGHAADQADAAPARAHVSR